MANGDQQGGGRVYAEEEVENLVNETARRAATEALKQSRKTSRDDGEDEEIVGFSSKLVKQLQTTVGVFNTLKDGLKRNGKLILKGYAFELDNYDNLNLRLVDEPTGEDVVAEEYNNLIKLGVVELEPEEESTTEEAKSEEVVDVDHPAKRARLE